MKYSVFFVIFVITFSAFAQNIQVDTQTFTPQQLIEDILIDSNCITNVVVTNVGGGNFNSTEQSYGYFDATGTTFPFQSGLVLSTGKLSNVEGPNTTLSDDDAPNWNGDLDLETILNESNTVNATIIEFDFTPIASQVSFNYIFASEEYQENDVGTCNYSDLFGFLIRPINELEYTNIALVPNTQTPVKVTTVHPEIPNGCLAENEIYFESWNGPTAPINFNGQTKVLTATAITIPNETYHVKLVIADEQNYRFDSAVFLEAGSFQLSTNLGEDRLFANNNPICEGETLVLDAFTSGNGITYKWFKDAIELPLEVNSNYTVIDAGVYTVEVSLGNNCISYGEIIVDYTEKLQTTQVFLDLCDNDHDGLTFFDLNLATQFFTITGYPEISVINYFLTSEEATQNINPISNPQSFINTVPNQVIFARLENEYGCFAVESLTLRGQYTSSSITSFEACDDDNDGFATFNLNELRSLIQPEVSLNAAITFYNTYNDAATHTNQLSDSYINLNPNSEEIFVKAIDVYCELFTTIILNAVKNPDLLANQEITYCLNNYPETVKIDAGLINDISSDTFKYEWERESMNLELDTYEIEINEIGQYTVQVTNSKGCFSTRDIIVIPSKTAIINEIFTEELNGNNTITIHISGEGNYEYSLDDSSNGFQESNVFLNVSSGVHIVYVRDLNGCGTVEQRISILGFPRFFTPNNDGYNDTWKPLIGDSQSSLAVEIYIFDRFGKLITQLNPLGNGWDGIKNGVPLPSSDYWYRIIFEDGKIYYGHFSLKR